MRHVGHVLDGVLYRIFSKMPREKLRALLTHFEPEQRAYWNDVFNLGAE
jgi:hypothetical protein